MSSKSNAEDKTYGDLILVCGDFHIPLRQEQISDKIKQQFVGQNKIQHVICTGNIGNQNTYDWLKGLTENCHIVKGQYDDNNMQQISSLTPVYQYKSNLILGSGNSSQFMIVPWGDEESLSVYMKESDSDIMIHGQTHEARLSRIDKKFFLNPGSITGAYGPLAQEVVPEFTIIEVMGDQLGVFIYHLINSELIVEKALIQK